MIRANDVVRFKSEWQDAGDESIEFVALADEDGGRVAVRAVLGLPIDPVSVVLVSMLQP